MTTEPRRISVTWAKHRAFATHRTAFLETDLSCHACAQKTVWVEDSEGDYYDGPTYICISCGAEFCHPSGPLEEPYLSERVNPLRIAAGLPPLQAEPRP